MWSAPKATPACRGLGLDPATADDTLLRSYSSHYFKYHGDRRVFEEWIREAPNASATNTSKTPPPLQWTPGTPGRCKPPKPCPTATAGSVYTNAAGWSSSSRRWKPQQAGNGSPTGSTRRWAFHGGGQTLRHRERDRAVEGLSNTLRVTLKANAGLVYENVYYTEDNPEAGAVVNYQKELLTRKGSAGTNVKLRETSFASQTVESVTIHPFASKTTFLREGVPSTTSYARPILARTASPRGWRPPRWPPSRSTASSTTSSSNKVKTPLRRGRAGHRLGPVPALPRHHRHRPSGRPNEEEQPKGRRTYTATWFDPIGRSWPAPTTAPTEGPSSTGPSASPNAPTPSW